jgi:hypothetical protein
MIQPIDLPSGAGLEYGQGDVRHFSEGDGVNVPGLANPTRYLAQRDNVLATKVNECISTLNNRELVVPLPVPRTVVAALTQETICNFRIPAGYEARVVNAAVSSSPLSSEIELIVYYAEGFGNTTGTAVVTTSGEFTSGVSFYQEGEFIIVVKNKGSASLTMTGSVLVTMRPLGEEGSLLVGSVVAGPRGAPGSAGPPGPPGAPGTGGAGSPGMVWTGTWELGRNYSAKEVASDGTVVISSYIARYAHTSNVSNRPPSDAWDTVAQGSAGSSGTGVPGPAGPAGGEPIFAYNLPSGTLYTSADWVGDSYGPTEWNYAKVNTSSVRVMGIPEYSIENASGTSVPLGLAFLQQAIRLCFTGWGTLQLPGLPGAKTDYTNANIKVAIASNGTIETSSGEGRGFICYPHPSQVDRYVIAGFSASPQPAVITVVGGQTY